MIDKSAYLQKIEEHTFIVLEFKSELSPSQSKILELMEKLLASSKRLKKRAIAGTNAKQFTSDLRKKVQASEKKSVDLSTSSHDAKTALADQVAMVKEKTTLADTEKSKLQGELSSLRIEFESYCRESKKKFDDMNTSYNELRTRLA